MAVRGPITTAQGRAVFALPPYAGFGVEILIIRVIEGPILAMDLANGVEGARNWIPTALHTIGKLPTVHI